MCYLGFMYLEGLGTQASNSKAKKYFFKIAMYNKKLNDDSLLTRSDDYGMTLAHKIAEAGYNFLDDTYFKVNTQSGLTVAHYLAMHLYNFTDENIFTLECETGWTVAHELARAGHIFKDKKEIIISDKSGWSVAHEMAKQGYVFKDIEVMMITNDSGWTVAHEIARQGTLIYDPAILRTSDIEGWTVAHESIKSFLKSTQIPEEFISQIAQIELVPKTNIALDLVDRGFYFTDSSILNIIVENGWTIAHELAYKGYTFVDPEILQIIDDDGLSVAHIMALYGHIFTDNTILNLKNCENVSVAQIIGQRENIFNDFYLLNFRSIDRNTKSLFKGWKENYLSNNLIPIKVLILKSLPRYLGVSSSNFNKSLQRSFDVLSKEMIITIIFRFFYQLATFSKEDQKVKFNVFLKKYVRDTDTTYPLSLMNNLKNLLPKELTREIYNWEKSFFKFKNCQIKAGHFPYISNLDSKWMGDMPTHQTGRSPLFLDYWKRSFLHNLDSYTDIEYGEEPYDDHDSYDDSSIDDVGFPEDWAAYWE